MNVVKLQFLGVHMMEPEDFLCALLADSDSQKLVPVWMSLSDGARLSSRTDGFNPTRPDTHDLLIELIELQGGVSSMLIKNVHEGVFYVEITTGQGHVLDARVSDALALTSHFDVSLTIDEEILNKVGIFISEDDLDQYFDIDYDASGFVLGETSRPDAEDSESTSASGDAQADADFSALMQSMGLSEEELRLGTEGDEEEKSGGEGTGADGSVDDGADEGETSDGDSSDDDDIWGENRP